MEYVRLLIRDLAGLGLDLPTIPTLYADCEPAIAVAKGASTRSRTRHIDFEIWLCRDYVRRELVQLVYVPTDLQIAVFSPSDWALVLTLSIEGGLCRCALVCLPSCVLFASIMSSRDTLRGCSVLTGGWCWWQ